MQKTREGSDFFKHIENKHGGLKKGEKFEEYFDILIIKFYKRPMIRNIEEGTFFNKLPGWDFKINEWMETAKKK